MLPILLDPLWDYKNKVFNTDLEPNFLDFLYGVNKTVSEDRKFIKKGVILGQLNSIRLVSSV